MSIFKNNNQFLVFNNVTEINLQNKYKMKLKDLMAEHSFKESLIFLQPPRM